MHEQIASSNDKFGAERLAHTEVLSMQHQLAIQSTATLDNKIASVSSNRSAFGDTIVGLDNIDTNTHTSVPVVHLSSKPLHNKNVNQGSFISSSSHNVNSSAHVHSNINTKQKKVRSKNYDDAVHAAGISNLSAGAAGVGKENNKWNTDVQVKQKTPKTKSAESTVTSSVRTATVVSSARDNTAAAANNNNISEMIESLSQQIKLRLSR